MLLAVYYQLPADLFHDHHQFRSCIKNGHQKTFPESLPPQIRTWRSGLRHRIWQFCRRPTRWLLPTAISWSSSASFPVLVNMAISLLSWRPWTPICIYCRITHFFALDPIGRIWPKPVFIAAFSCVIGPWGRLRKRLSTRFWRIKMDATLDRFGREENLAWWNSITQSPVLAMLTSQAPIPKITGGRSKTWCSGLNFLCCMGSTTFLSTPSREPRMLSRKSWCPTWKLAWPQGSILMCRSIHEIKPWTCAVGILIGWFGIACIGPRATPLGSSPPSTSTSISAWTVATSFQMARFHKIIWGQVGMPSQDLKTKIQRNFGAFLSNDFTSLVAPTGTFGDFFPMAWGASPGAVGATGHHGGACRSTSTTSIVAYDAWWHWLEDFDPKTTKRSLVIPMRLRPRWPPWWHPWWLDHISITEICRSTWTITGFPNRDPQAQKPSTTTWSPTPTSWQKPLNNDLDRNFQLYSSDSVRLLHNRHSTWWSASRCCDVERAGTLDEEKQCLKHAFHVYNRQMFIIYFL